VSLLPKPGLLSHLSRPGLNVQQMTMEQARGTNLYLRDQFASVHIILYVNIYTARYGI